MSSATPTPPIHSKIKPKFGFIHHCHYLFCAERSLEVFVVGEKRLDFVGVILGDDEIFVENGLVGFQPAA